MTSADPYKNVITGVTVETNSQYGGDVGGYPAFYAVDGDESTLWYTNWDDPVTYSGTKWIIMDLHDAYELDQMEYFNNGTAQIKDHEIQVSLDGVHWKTVEKSVWERKAENRIFTDLGGVSARYVKVLSYDRHHNSANEIRIYKKDGTSAFNPGSNQKNAEISDADLTFLQNYIGATAAETGGAWLQREPADINYNNEIDAYDLAFTLSQKGLEKDNRRAGGALKVTLDKNDLKAGETAVMTFTGSSLKDIYAFGARVTLGADVLASCDITTTLLGESADMQNYSKFQSGSSDYVIAASFEGNHAGLAGDQDLAQITLKARKDLHLDVEEFVPIVISTGLDCRLAISEHPVDLTTLENLVSAADMEVDVYTAETGTALRNAISAANDVLDNPEATQEELDQAALNLLDAIIGMERSELTRSRALEGLTDWISEKGPEAAYTQSALDKVLAAVADAQSVVLFYSDNSAYVDEAIQELCDRLNTILDTDNSTEAGKALLTGFIDSFAESDAAHFTPESMDALKASAAGSIEDMAAALIALEPVPEIDRAQLGTLLNMLEVLHPEEADYNDHIMDVHDAAKAAFNDEAAEQPALDEHASNVHQALVSLLGEPADRVTDALKSLVYKGDHTSLEGTTTESAAAFSSALENARTVLEQENPAQEDLENAYLTLQSAMNGLQDRPETDRKALEDLIEKAEGINESLYTADSVKALNTALEEAKAVYNNEAADQQMIDDAAKALEQAFNSLEEVKNPDPGKEPGKEPGKDPEPGKEPGKKPADKEPAKKPATAASLHVSGLLAAAAASLGFAVLTRKKKED